MTSPPRPRRADSFAPRRMSALGQGYSALVKALKLAMPLAALAIIGILVVQMTENGQQKKITALPQNEKTTPGQIELVGAKYEGVDEEGLPYTVIAEKAVRAMNAPDMVSFENPAADITLDDGVWIALKGKTGLFDNTNALLTMKEGVTVFHDGGYEMRVEDISINLKKKTAVTQSPVMAQGPMGTIAAKGMEVVDSGDRVIFGGPALLTIFRLGGQKQGSKG